MATNEIKRKDLYSYLKNNEKKDKKPINEIAKLFIGPCLSKTTFYRWVRQYKATGNIKRKIAPGRPVKIATEETIEKLKTTFNHKSGCSQRAAGRALSC